jgi:hypothetical protein
MFFKYRLQRAGLELPAAVRASQLEFDRRLAEAVERMPDRMEGQIPEEDQDFKDAFDRLEEEVRICCSEGPQQSMATELQTFLALSRTVESSVMSLDNEIRVPDTFGEIKGNCDATKA